MSLLKLAGIINWVVIALLALLVTLSTLFPSRGGDAAGRGLGEAIYWLAVIVLVVLLVLNLLPYKWAKYAGLAVVVIPIVFTTVESGVRNFFRAVSGMIERTEPIFPDKERDAVAKVIFDGNTQKLEKLLAATPIDQLNREGEMLLFAIRTANAATYKPEERLECVRILVRAGARLDSITDLEVPVHFNVASSGDADLLRFLLEQGADPNAEYGQKHIIFEAIGGYKDPTGSVNALLEFGARIDGKALLDDEDGPVTPLFAAAMLDRWDVCVALIKKGADIHFTSKSGRNLKSFVEEKGPDYTGGYYGSKEAFAQLRSLVGTE